MSRSNVQNKQTASSMTDLGIAATTPAQMDFITTRNRDAPLRLLAFDGGGVRGLSSLLILDAIMQAIAKEEKRLKIRARDDNRALKPCDYFDLIGGTSTGGIIAILLGRLRLTCEECIHIYSELAEEIFRKDRSVNFAGLRMPTGATRFSGVVLEKAIKGALKKLGYAEDELMWDSTLFEELTPASTRHNSIWSELSRLRESPTDLRKDFKSSLKQDLPKDASNHAPQAGTDSQITIPPESNNSSQTIGSSRSRHPTWRLHPRNCNTVHKKDGKSGCRAFVVSVSQHALGVPRLFCTWDPNIKNTTIWEALRATSAAPTFFEPMVMGEPRTAYLDGGMGFNNPSEEVENVAQETWPDRPIGLLCSIGTGLQTLPSVSKGLSWLPFGLGVDISLIGTLASMATSTQRVHNAMTRKYHRSEAEYIRFDVDSGLANISLEHWMKESEMVGVTTTYLEEPQQRHNIEKLAQQAVLLTQAPPKFQLQPTHFRVGITNNDVTNGNFSQDKLDFKTGYPLGVTVTMKDFETEEQTRQRSPMGRAGLVVNTSGNTTEVYPVRSDLDHDGRKDEAIVLSCRKTDNICLRMLKKGIPKGKYTVKFIVCFYDTAHTAPNDLIFSVGRPYNTGSFENRFVDVEITPDIVPVLLHPDAIRVRVTKERYEKSKGRGWIEIEGDEKVEVGLDGALGFVINKRFIEGEFVGGWSFGGVHVVPVLAQ